MILLHQMEDIPRDSGEASAEGTDLSDSGRNPEKVTSAVEAVLRIIEEETAAIRMSGVADISRFSERKGQALMILDRFLAAGLPSSRTADFVSKLEALRRALDVNRSLLKIHIDAVNEVSQIIVRSVQDSQADGTYAQLRKSYGQF